MGGLAQTVNAYYQPTDNSINLPSATLAWAFADGNPSDEQMLGIIGTIVGHEITHGFDTTGSQFDADGNLNNWWTQEDRAAFQELTQQVAQYYGAIEVLPGECVDGQLTIGETVADLAACPAPWRSPGASRISTTMNSSAATPACGG